MCFLNAEEPFDQVPASRKSGPLFLKRDGHVRVNGQKVDRPSFRLKPGDVVSLADRSKDMVAFAGPLEIARPPAYLELDREKRSVRVREVPEREQIPIQCETSLVIEYYSR